MSSIKKFTDRAISPNTRLAYEKALRRFRDWLRTRNLKLNDSSLAEYLTSIYKAGLSHSTCAQCVAAVKWMARETRTADLVGKTTGLVLKGIARSGKRGCGQVKGLLWDQVDTVVNLEFRKGTPAGFRNAAMFAVAADAMLRISEIQAMRIDDIELNADDRGFSVLTIPRSKTDQEWIGEKNNWVRQPPFS